MKKWLYGVERKYSITDKSKYNFVLDQSERTNHIGGFEGFLQNITQEDFLLYPNTNNFKKKISKFYNKDIDNIFLCAGSDVGIKSIFESFTDGGRIISSNPSFPMYKVYSELYNCEYFGIPHEEDYTISMEKILSNITNDTDLIILANPNSPMGEYKSFDEIRVLLEQDVPVLIDEAYIEFTDNESLLSYTDEYSNLLVTRTFSKAFGAAGCRVGMVFSNKNNIELVSKFRQMYEISGVSIKFCEYLLDNYTIVDDYIKNVNYEKNKLISILEKKYEVIDSNCNWIHFNDQSDNKKTIEIFEKSKVLVKYCEIPNDDRKKWCRMTIQPNITNSNFIKEII